MAIKETVEIEVESNAADASQEFTDAVKELTATVKEFGNSANKGFQGAEKGSKKLGTSFKNIAKASVVFTLVEKALGMLAEAFKSNQKVVDVFNTAFEFVSLIAGQVAQVIGNVTRQVGQSSENFDALKKVASSLLTVALTPLKLTFQAIRFGVLKLSLAYEKSFLGQGRPERIDELTAGLAEVKDSMVEIGTEAIQAGKDVVNNIGEAVTEASNISKQVIEGVKEINVKSTLDQAKALVKLKGDAELAEAELQGLIEKFDLQAEKQRQIRDDERLSIEERLAANNTLGEILKEQQEAQLEQAQRILDAANAELEKDQNNIEFKKARIQAENELAAVKAQVAGFEAEQLTNEVSLQRELLELQNTRNETTRTRGEIETEVAIINERNENKRAEMEAAFAQEKIKNQIAELENQAKLAQSDQERADLQLQIAELEKESALNTANEVIRLEKLKQEEQKRTVNNVVNGLQAINQLAQAFAKDDEKSAKKAFLVNKAVGISTAVIQTAQAVTAALTAGGNPLKLATGQQFIEAGIAAASGAAQIATIAKQQFGGGSGGSTPSVNAPTGSGGGAPQFNVVGNTGINAIAQSLQNRGPIQAFVVGSEVTSQQSLDRNRINNATFG